VLFHLACYGFGGCNVSFIYYLLPHSHSRTRAVQFTGILEMLAASVIKAIYCRDDEGSKHL
jgi:hypothetical protein